MMSLRKNMPLLTKNEGVWDGYYRVYNYSGNQIDEHKSRLLCRIIDDTEYHQTNIYRWKSGQKELRDFPATIEGNKLVFSTYINGWAAEVNLDEHNRTMMLHWERKGEPDLYLYEMIQLSDDGLSRARTWQWFKKDKLFQRTLIDEIKISDDWALYDNQDPEYSDIAQNI
tara:strand:- start:29 stop:538 length:510 start_codon:yes stop_codon:yes gene_type:complete